MKAFITILIIIAIGVGAFFYFTRPIAAPTTDISTSTAGDQLPAPTDTSSGQKLYRISSSGSKAQFSATEELHGKPFTAVGTTDQVSGDISIDTSAAPKITIGTIKVDARTLKTDSAERDGAIARMILKSDQSANNYIVFVPTAVTGLPTTIENSKPFTFIVTGNLTISGVTKPATLAATGTLTDDVFSGSVKTAVKRSDYGLTIPNFSFVANVSDTINVTATFSANRVK